MLTFLIDKQRFIKWVKSLQISFRYKVCRFSPPLRLRHRSKQSINMPRGRKTNLSIQLTPAERAVLESWQRSTSIRAGLVRRGNIVLMLADGDSISHISRIVGIRRRFIYKWIARFTEQRIAGLVDKAGRGRPVATPAVEDNSEQDLVGGTTFSRRQ